jgi:TusA-related sulfurtransferase
MDLIEYIEDNFQYLKIKKLQDADLVKVLIEDKEVIHSAVEWASIYNNTVFSTTEY